MNLTRLQQEKALRHLGYATTDDFFREGITPEILTQIPQAYVAAIEVERIDAIKTEAERRITGFAGNEVQRIRELAEAVALIYQGIRPSLSAPLQTQLDAKMAVFLRIKNIRTEAARLIADANATPNWPE